MATITDPEEQPQGRRRLLFILAASLLILLLLCLGVWFFVLRPRGSNGSAGEAQSVPSDAPTQQGEPNAVPGGPYTVGEGQSLTLDGSGSTGTNITYHWDFGDGNTGEGVSPSHTYNDGPVQLTLTLTVTDEQSRTHTASTQVTVDNLPPTANTGGPYSCQVGGTVTLTGLCDDPGPTDRPTLTCTWTDAQGATLTELDYTCPSTPGEVTVILTATDKDGSSAQSAATITVGQPGVEQPPQAVITVFLRSKNGLIFGFSGQASSDPDGQIINYGWDFGDGTGDMGPEVMHEYAAHGNYTITLTVTDNSNLQNSTSVTIP